MSNKKKTTKRSLISSVISLILCISMLIGTTFAWFTDSVTSGRNRIQAGNLDVELTHADKDETGEVTTSTALFNDVTLWEPGAVAYENFTITNAGTLALKYIFDLDVAAFNKVAADTTKSLKTVLRVQILDNTVTEGSRPSLSNTSGYSLEEFLTGGGQVSAAALEPGASKKVSVVLFWPDNNANDVDNIYNLKNGALATEDADYAGDSHVDQLFIDMSIALHATQYTSETDSFDNKYDESADGEHSYDVKTVTASATTSVSDGQDTVITTAATPSDEAGKTTTVTFPQAISAFTADSTSTLTVEASPTVVANNKFTVSSSGAVAVGAIDLNVTVDGVKISEFKDSTNNPVPVTVETYVAKGLTNVSIEYNGVPLDPSDVTYDPATGKLTFKTTHFSTYVVSSMDEAYIVATDTIYDTLQEAIDAAEVGGKVFMLRDVLVDNPIAGSCITVNKPIEIEGNNHKIYCVKESLADNSRLVNVYDVSDGNVIFNNVSIESNHYGGYMRGLNIYDLNKVHVILNKVNISLPHYYAFNIGTGCIETSITINNSYIKGWSTIYNHSSGIQLIANSSQFDSVNPTLSGGSTNSFGNVIVAEYYDWNGSGDSNNNTFTFNQCSFTADKNHPESDVTQVVFDIRSPYMNTLNVNNCSFEKLSTPEYIRVCYDTMYEADEDKRNEMKETNKLCIDGTFIDCETAEYVDYYLDE